MSDPWGAFVEHVGSADRAGYFERAAGQSSPRGHAWWFTRAEALPPVRGAADLRRVRSEVRRHLRGGGRPVALGYLGFDAVGVFEPALAATPRGSPFPMGEFLLARDVVESSLPPRRTSRRKWAVAATGRPRSDTLTRRQFGQSVRRLRADIREGEAFQVVLAHRRGWPRPDDLLARAGRLRARERYAYFYYVRTGDREIVGASPESVAEVEGRTARVNPIAGTLPRESGRTRRPLRQDRKELSEHRMLVDLARNDIGRVARPGSVRVPWHERRVRFAALEHLVSRVEGRLRAGTDPWDVLAATFPAGTVSGAPKIRATQLLRREERTWRGPYAGTVGLLRAGNRADWALNIRAGFAAGSTLYTAAGAGVVHASEPAREFEETLAKLSVVESALVGEDR